jgi:hypothetical protein
VRQLRKGLSDVLRDADRLSRSSRRRRLAVSIAALNVRTRWPFPAKPGSRFKQRLAPRGQLGQAAFAAPQRASPLDPGSWFLWLRRKLF